MKSSSPNILLIIFALMLCSVTYLVGQTAQPQNSNQNTTPVQHGTDGSLQNPNQQQGNQYNSPGNNNGTGTKPVNGSYGNPGGTTGSTGATSTPGRGNSGATGVTGVTGPIYNNNGSGPATSPQ